MLAIMIPSEVRPHFSTDVHIVDTLCRRTLISFGSAYSVAYCTSFIRRSAALNDRLHFCNLRKLRSRGAGRSLSHHTPLLTEDRLVGTRPSHLSNPWSAAACFCPHLRVYNPGRIAISATHQAPGMFSSISLCCLSECCLTKQLTSIATCKNNIHFQCVSQSPSFPGCDYAHR